VLLRTPFEPYAFDGGDAVDCTLVSGPIRDFNRDVRRERAQWRCHDRSPKRDRRCRGFRIVFAAVGAHECAIGGAAADRGSRPVTRSSSSGSRRRRCAPRDPLARPSGVALAVRIECR
jgi:hypothetical protein